MVTFDELLSGVLWNNTGKEYLIALGIFLGLFIILKLFDSYALAFLKKSAKRTKFQWDDAIFGFLSGIKWPFYAYLSFYIGSKFLALPETLSKVIFYILVVFIFYYAALGATKIADHFIKKQIEKKQASNTTEGLSMLNVLGLIVKGLIWLIAVLMVLDNFGIQITPLLAGLGVGGIAIALALQSILGDLFSAFTIYLDKPFKEGDFIVIGKDMGTVKHIGIKTTRIQTLQGEELVVSNSELTSTRINNYKRMQRRRIVFAFGVEYTTSLQKLKKINEIVAKIIKDIELTDLDRVHFKEFGDFSLNYEVVYFIKSNDYNKYMDVQQEINFKLKEAFEKAKIEFAFPTQTIHIQK